jgi:putative transposase
MPRPKRDLQPDYCYHVTVRCNNREFHLTSQECREVLLYAIKRAQEKYGFFCIMSNHIHYLIEPKAPLDLPQIMHWLNWYTAMCVNRMLNRKGHFWEQRYHSTGFHKDDKQRALNTLRDIHANPKAAGIREGFFYTFSNYGTYDRLTDDGLTQWHPAFFSIGNTLDECAARYRYFCIRYTPPKKTERQYFWGSRLLAGRKKPRRGQNYHSAGQMKFSFVHQCQVSGSPEIAAIAQTFTDANRASPAFA